MRTNLTKAVGISLLAIVGILAVNASAAHATWTLLKGGKPAANNLLNLNAALFTTELLVPGLSLNINCTGGSGTGHLQGGSTLKGEVHVKFTGCTVLGFPSCEVRSSGFGVGAGTILATGAGTGSLLGSGATLSLTGTFTEILIFNELCPFNETEASVTGGLTLYFLNAATSSSLHTGDLNDAGLLFGEQGAVIDGTAGVDAAHLSVSEASGGTWAIDHS
jgi:hypothetical protein